MPVAVPKGPSAAHLKTLVPNTVSGIAFGILEAESVNGHDLDLLGGGNVPK